HSVERARAAVGEARSAGIANVSIDLMMWLPQQTLADWQETVESVIEVNPEHASLYLLELYPNAPLKEEMARSGWSLGPDQDAGAMSLRGLERLEAAGYGQYEISNVARPGFSSRHNLKYWQDGEWLGFGCGAHSTRDGVRWKNPSNTEDYVARVTRGDLLVTDKRELTDRERLEGGLFPGVRFAEGVDIFPLGAPCH